MKKFLFYVGTLPILLLFAGCCFSGECDDDFNIRNNYSPVIISRAELEASVTAQPQQTIDKSGKIYIKDNLMFINEVNKGFHVYNYSDPENPVKTAFINVPGATDLAMRNNTIYINQAVDLVTIDYDPVTNMILTSHRNRNVFPTKPSPTGATANTGNDEIVINWTLN